MNPKVSIIIPILRTDLTYVRDCLNSVLNQSYPHNRLEIIIYEEGSSKRYKNDLENLVRKIQTIDILHYGNNEQTSLAQSRNEAINRSNGSLILLLDSDDFLHPDAISKCVKKFQREIDFVYTNHLYVSDYANIIIHKRDKSVYQELLSLYKNTIYDPFLHSTFLFHCQIFRRTIFDMLGGFREDLKFGEEVDFHLRVEELSEHNNFGLVAEYLYNYRNNPSSICHQNDKYRELIKNISNILVESAQRRGYDVHKAVRIGRAKPTNAAHYALYDSMKNLIGLPYFNYKTLKMLHPGINLKLDNK